VDFFLLYFELNLTQKHMMPNEERFGLEMALRPFRSIEELIISE
jgi:hypothetical protein